MFLQFVVSGLLLISTFRTRCKHSVQECMHALTPITIPLFVQECEDTTRERQKKVRIATRFDDVDDMM